MVEEKLKDSPTWRERRVDDEGNPVPPLPPVLDPVEDLTGHTVRLEGKVRELLQGTACVVFPMPPGSAIGIWTSQKAKVGDAIQVTAFVTKGSDPNSLEVEIETKSGEKQPAVLARRLLTVTE